MLQNIAVFIISQLFSFYIGAVLLRLILAWARADFYNPLSQFLVKITNPPLIPLRRIIPAIGKIDTAAIVLALGLKIIVLLLILTFKGMGGIIVGNIFNIIMIALADLVRLVIWIFIVAMIIQAIMSWIGNSYGNPMASLLDSITSPLLRPLRRIIPTIGMVDLSPLVAILLLQVVLIILQPFPNIA